MAPVYKLIVACVLQSVRACYHSCVPGNTRTGVTVWSSSSLWAHRAGRVFVSEHSYRSFASDSESPSSQLGTIVEDNSVTDEEEEILETSESS